MTNVIAFAVVIALGSAYLAFAVYRVHPGRDTTSVSMDLANTSTILPGTGVSINGLRVGEVTSIAATATGARVTLRYPTNQRIPRDSQVTIGQQSALGEPYIDFEPRTETGPYLASGDLVAATSIDQPESIPGIFSSLEGLTSVLSAGPLAGLLATLQQAFEGNGAALTDLGTGAQAVAAVLTSRTAELERMFGDTQRYTPQLGDLVDGLPSLASGVALLLRSLRNTADATSELVHGSAYEDLSEQIHPFLQRLNPYVKEVLPNVLDAVGPLLPIATALNETLPQLNASKLLSQLLGLVGSDGATRLTLTIPPR